jgi:histidyl-tRNA synthetase
MLDVMLDANERGTTMGGRNRKDIVQRLVKKHQRFTLSDQVKEAVHHLHRWISTEGAIDETLPRLRTLLPKHSKTAEVQFEQWIATLEMIDEMGIDTTKLHIVPGLARNWTYYTGIVFEFTNSDGTYFGGGGRYDELVRLMGAEVDVPAIGFAYDVDAILQHMSNQQRARGSSPLLFALPSAYTDDILFWLREMRSANLPVTVVNQEEAPAEALHATENGGVWYKNRVYSTDEISDLIEAIKNA